VKAVTLRTIDVEAATPHGVRTVKEIARFL
jgi:hypothetical protein